MSERMTLHTGILEASSDLHLAFTPRAGLSWAVRCPARSLPALRDPAVATHSPLYPATSVSQPCSPHRARLLPRHLLTWQICDPQSKGVQ